MKYSIRRQMAAIFIGLFACILGAVLIINNGFLGNYYLSHKTKELVRTYHEIDEILQQGDMTDDNVKSGILTRTERANIDLIVLDSGGKQVLTTVTDDDPRLRQMLSEQCSDRISIRMRCWNRMMTM